MASILHNSILTLARQVLSILLGLVASVVLARVLGVEGQGTYALLILVPISMHLFLCLGIPSATVYYLGQKTYDSRSIVYTNIVTSLVLSTISMVLGSLFCWWYFGSVVGKDWWLAILSIPFLFLHRALLTVFQGIEDFTSYNFASIFSQFSLLASILCLVFGLQWSVKGALIAFLLSQLSTVFLLFYFLYKNALLNAGLYQAEYAKESIVFGLKGYISNILTFINYRADVFLIAYYCDLFAVGWYTVAVALVEKIWVISQAVSTVIYARLSNMTDAQEQALLTAQVARIVSFISLLLGVLFFLLAKFAIILLYGQAYAASYQALIYLLPGILALALSRVLSHYFAAYGRPEINSYIAAIIVIINISLNVLLIPQMGIIGAAVATSISYSIDMLLKSSLFWYYNKIPFWQFLMIRKSDFVYFYAYLKG